MPPCSPEIIVIAGPNGAGKTTCANVLLPETLHIEHFVNADLIARGLSPFAPEKAVFAAGRIMLQRIHDLRARGESFAFETTLATRGYLPFLQNAQSEGWRVHLIFVALETDELALARVRDRVARGGHNVPAETVRRRFTRGLSNFFVMYQPIVDSWLFYDNSASAPVALASGMRGTAPEIQAVKRYDAYRTLANAPG